MNYSYSPASNELRREVQLRLEAKKQVLIELNTRIKCNKEEYEEKLALMNEQMVLKYAKKSEKYKERYEPILETLEVNKKRIEAEIMAQLAVIAPIKKLPIELLAMIFVLSVKNDGGLKRLLLVCKAWKAVAETTPRLWNDINMTFVSSRHYKAIKCPTGSPFCIRCYTMTDFQKVIKRVAQVELSLAIMGLQKGMNVAQRAFMVNLLPQCERLFMSVWACDLFRDQDIPISLPRLIELSIEEPRKVEGGVMNIPKLIVPCLQNLWLKRVGLEPWCNQGIFNRKLTHLSIQYAETPIDPGIFAECTSLRNLVLIGSPIAQTWIESKYPFLSLEELTLSTKEADILLPLMDMPLLITLFIKYYGAHQPDNSLQTKGLKFPNLKTVQVEGWTANLLHFDAQDLQLLSVDFLESYESAVAFNHATTALLDEHVRPIEVHLSVDGNDKQVLAFLRSLIHAKTLKLRFIKHPAKLFFNSFGAKGKKHPFSCCPYIDTLEVVIGSTSQLGKSEEVEPTCSDLFTPYLGARLKGGWPIENFSYICKLEGCSRI